MILEPEFIHIHIYIILLCFINLLSNTVETLGRNATYITKAVILQATLEEKGSILTALPQDALLFSCFHMLPLFSR